jgi:hypothetical protein
MELRAPISDDLIAPSASGRIHRIARFCGGLTVSLLVWALIVVAVLCIAGRIRIVATAERGSDVNIATNAVAVVEPVPALALKEGEIVVARLPNDRRLAYYKVSSIDPSTRAVTVRDAAGRLVQLNLGSQTWTVFGTAPFIGAPFHSATGPAQAAALVMSGLLLIGMAEVSRRRCTAGAAPAQLTP